MYYQPTISLTTYTIDGAEALLRWHHPVKGMISPLAFIPLAERSGQIVPIGRWVLGQACAQAVSWQADTGANPPLTIAVNLSMRQLSDPDLVADVRRILTDTGLDPRLLTLEITESVLMDDVDEVLPRLHALKDLGLRLAIDDFGTGYSSLAYLRRFPVDIVKIDKTFVDGAAAGAPGGAALIRAIVDLSRSLEAHHGRRRCGRPVYPARAYQGRLPLRPGVPFRPAYAGPRHGRHGATNVSPPEGAGNNRGNPPIRFNEGLKRVSR